MASGNKKPSQPQTNNTMKTKAIHLSLALLTITGASAQPGEGPEGHRPPPVPPLFALLDADHDGAISAAEIENATAALATLDDNNDGEITLDELRPPRPGGDGPPDGDGPPPENADAQGPPPGNRPAPPIIAALDTDRDGTISATELKAAPESLKAFDKNNDGELSPRELAPKGHRPPRHMGNPGRRPNGPPPTPGDEPDANAE